jgi:hypothetical protein
MVMQAWGAYGVLWPVFTSGLAFPAGRSDQSIGGPGQAWAGQQRTTLVITIDP